jgi:Icc-related predicted phosphoesterase
VSGFRDRPGQRPQCAPVTRFVCISDTHSRLRNVVVPDGDVLIHAGDLSGRTAQPLAWNLDPRGKLRGLVYMDTWEQFRALGELPHAHKLVIAGNHDHALKFEPDLGHKLAREYGLLYLDAAPAEVAGVRVWGSAWTPWFLDWAFNFQRGAEGKRQAARHYSQIPNDTQLLVTHGPPHGILDQLDESGSEPGARVGGMALRDRVCALPELRAHVFGHIHCAYGTKRENDVLFVNASTCTEKYRPTNPPIVMDWDGTRFELVSGEAV